MAPRLHCIVTADSRHATIYACRHDGRGVHLEYLSTLENPHEAEHAHERPSFIGGVERRGSVARSGAHAAPHALAPGHTSDEEQKRFARELSDWLAGQRASMDVPPVTLFAPPRFLGMLLPHVDRMGENVTLHPGEFAQLTAAELERHPTIVQAARDASDQ